VADSSGRMVTTKVGGTGERGDPNAGLVDPGATSERAMEEHPAWPMVSRLPVRLAVSIPLRPFKVRDLMHLACGQTIESVWPMTEDVPLKVGDIQLSWCEFELVNQHMGLRLTRLA